LPKSLTI
jgi:hypothetical protein